MIGLALTFVVLAIVALLFGFGGIAGLSMQFAWWLFAGGILLAVVFAIFGRGGPSTPAI